MSRRIYLINIGIVIAILGIFIWKLDIPNWKKLDLTLLTDIPSSTQVFDVNGELAGTLHGSENRTLVSLAEVPAHVRNAFIAAEDQHFYSHNGINVKRMFGALIKNIKSLGYAQGASTITQQLIKITHLTSDKTISRKVQEIRLALQLERQMTKDEILENYLNVVYFGRGAYGIGSASRVYFGKEVSDLTLEEGALLAGIIKSPSGFAPHINPEKSKSRRDAILRTMLDTALINNEEYNTAVQTPVHIIQDTVGSIKYGWYMDSVLSEAEGIMNLSSEEILSGGYHIYTGLDPKMQDVVDVLFTDSSNFPADANDGTPVQASMTVMDTYTGEIRAIAGGRQYEVRRGLNRSTQIRRQPGSVFKPVSTYAAAIDAFGFIPSSSIDDTPRTFPGNYTPGNAGGANYGKVTLREALSRSLNIATVDLADLIGIDTVRRYAENFGLSLSAHDNNLSLSLGFLTDGISPVSVTAAYCALANGGTKVTPRFISKITDASGKILYESRTPFVRAVRDSTAYMVTDMLKTAAQTGSAKALSSAGMPVAAKTGTIEGKTGGTRDIWTVAYTPEIAVTVWMGFDNPSDMHIMPETEGGSGYPARLCASFLNSTASVLSGRDFKRPSSVSTAVIDALSLNEEHIPRLITEHTPEKYAVTELFHPGRLPETFSEYWTVPESVSDLHIAADTGNSPVISFTSLSNHAEYVLFRKQNGETSSIAELNAHEGEIISYTDTTVIASEPAQYTVIPRNRHLYGLGMMLAGQESAAVLYKPGGILNMLKGSGTDDAEQEPGSYDIRNNQSLFG